MIYRSGIKVEKAKVKDVSQVPQLENVNWLRAFLGLCKYYRKFVKGFSSITKPMMQLTQIDREFIWGETQEQTFQELKAV
jgi:hypothetical protein